MGIIATSKGGDFEQVPDGSFIARCYKMIDVGTQPAFKIDDKPQHKVFIYWELLEDEDGEAVRMKDGRPFSVQKQYTLSIHPKSNLRQDIDKWRGIPFTDEEAEAFDITKLLSAPCRIQVVREEKNGKTYTNVASVIFTKKKPEGVNETSWWSVSEPDMDAFEKLPDWVKEKVEASEEWNKAPRQDEVAEVDESEPINLDDMPAEFLKD